jgi:hypothetical protein
VLVAHTNNSDIGFAGGVAVSGHYVFLANGEDGLRIYDVSDSANPVNIGHSVDNHGLAEALGVTVAGNYAYVANNLAGLSVYDIADPSHPANVCQTNSGGYAGSIAVSGNYVYLANWNDGLRIYSVAPQVNLTGSGAQRLLAWFAPAPGFVVQQNTTLASTNWVTLTNTPSVTGSQNRVLLTPQSKSAFFRLKLP